jgi:hypothetical protein
MTSQRIKPTNASSYMGRLSPPPNKRDGMATGLPHSLSINPEPKNRDRLPIHLVGQPSIKVDGTLP